MALKLIIKDFHKNTIYVKEVVGTSNYDADQPLYLGKNEEVLGMEK